MSTRITGLMQDAMVVRNRTGLDHAPFPYLETLGHAASLAMPEDWTGNPHPTVNYGAPWLDPTCAISAASSCGMIDYVEWKLRNRPDIIENHDKLASICAVAAPSGYWFRLVGGIANPFDVFVLLLRKGISPNAMIHKSIATTSIGTVSGLTMWEHLISFLVFYTPMVMSACRAFNWPVDWISGVIRAMLEHDANPHLRIALEGK